VPEDIDVTVRLFAALREAAGTDRVALRLPAGTPAGAVWAHLPGGLATAPPPPGTRWALNDTWTLPGTPLRDGDVVAVLLPGAGG
jgi:molybdopterin converting factor small subunit